jgi:hypothetical protein
VRPPLCPSKPRCLPYVFPASNIRCQSNSVDRQTSPPVCLSFNSSQVESAILSSQRAPFVCPSLPSRHTSSVLLSIMVGARPPQLYCSLCHACSCPLPYATPLSIPALFCSRIFFFGRQVTPPPPTKNQTVAVPAIMRAPEQWKPASPPAKHVANILVAIVWTHPARNRRLQGGFPALRKITLHPTIASCLV